METLSLSPARVISFGEKGRGNATYVFAFLANKTLASAVLLQNT
jgi:hypothetical protein